MSYLKKRNMNAPRTERSNPLNVAVERRDKSVIDMVSDAIRHREVLLAYQPVMQAREPFGTAFHEGLIRVLDDTGRIIPARDFIGEVVETELGHRLDCIALDIGLHSLQRHPGLRLSVNMSARSIGYRDWTGTLERHLKRDAALGDRLMLEIEAESAMQSPELVIDFMDRLQPKGIAFALDNFGRGAMVMRHMRDFFFDAVKIDGRFVHDVAKSPDNAAVVRSLVAIAREFEMLIVANNVAKLQDAEFLAKNGVDCLQGNLFGASSVNPSWLSQGPEAKRA
jgi:EAL domain-containing protein (putative c-di-GMP-specific phosphodiesterase class I)